MRQGFVIGCATAKVKHASAEWPGASSACLVTSPKHWIRHEVTLPSSSLAFTNHRFLSSGETNSIVIVAPRFVKYCTISNVICNMARKIDNSSFASLLCLYFQVLGFIKRRISLASNFPYPAQAQYTHPKHINHLYLIRAFRPCIPHPRTHERH